MTSSPLGPAAGPPCSPKAALVAVSSFALYEWLGVVYYLSAGLLVGNAWEAVRRVRGARTHART